MAARFVLLYDADCGLCTFFARAVKVADLGRRIEPMALADPRADPWFAGTSEEERFGSFHVVRPSGDRLTRGRALLALVEALPLASCAARRVSGVRPAIRLANRVYDAMVWYRAFLAGQPAQPRESLGARTK